MKKWFEELKLGLGGALTDFIINKFIEFIKSISGSITIRRIAIIVIAISICCLTALAITDFLESPKSTDPTVQTDPPIQTDPTEESVLSDEDNITTYWPDPIFFITELPTSSREIEATLDKFTRKCDTKNSNNIPSSSIDSNAELLLQKASEVEKEMLSSGFDFSAQQEINKFREDAFELSSNNLVAKLIGDGHYRCFRHSKDSTQEQLQHAQNAIKYYARSIELSPNDFMITSNAAKSVSEIYMMLSLNETNTEYKVILLLRSMLYMRLSVRYYSSTSSDSYETLCRLTANTYLRLLMASSDIRVDKSILEYYYKQAMHFYSKAIENSTALSVDELSICQEEMAYAYTIYSDICSK